MKRAFTLLELMAAILLGSLIMLMIAGGLRSTIRSWESVQHHVATNYNRRSVLDLIKRQSSSLFFRDDVLQLEAANPRKGKRGGPTNQPPPSYSIPEGTSYFSGNIQELNFMSTISFLSDFPGQVAVRYYVVQGEPGEDELISELPHSRSMTYDDGEGDLDFSFDEGAVFDELEGQLYLYLEERNLFLASTMEGELDDPGDPFETVDAERGVDSDQEPSITEVQAQNTMKLFGPLRKFIIRYRNPTPIFNVDAADDDEEAWAETWNQANSNTYPTAIEFTLFYEPEGDPDEVAQIPLEDLDSIRMVIPLFDARNLVRGAPANVN